MNRGQTTLFYMYRDDLRLIGVDPSPLAGQVLRYISSNADAENLDSLGWAELITRFNSATVEAALFNAKVIFRATNFRKHHAKDSKVFQTNYAELETKMVELQSLLEKESANSKRMKEDMQMGFEADRLKMKNELRVAKVRLEAAREEARKA